MNICPRCGNKQVNTFYIRGETAEKGQKFCDVCVREKHVYESKILKKVFGDNKQ